MVVQSRQHDALFAEGARNRGNIEPDTHPSVHPEAANRQPPSGRAARHIAGSQVDAGCESVHLVLADALRCTRGEHAPYVEGAVARRGSYGNWRCSRMRRCGRASWEDDCSSALPMGDLDQDAVSIIPFSLMDIRYKGGPDGLAGSTPACARSCRTSNI